jgi:cytosine/adenosine deaminase-related metal-dependent hydrolase
MGPDLHAHPGDDELSLPGATLLPGLTNAHDHLFLDVLPLSGRGPYASAHAWSLEFPQRFRPALEPLLQIPEAVRAHWGGLRNLLSGATWVAHHDHLVPGMLLPSFPVRVVWPYRLLDSLPLEAHPRRARRGNGPLLVHVAEGTDAASRAEVRQLEKLGLLDRRTVLVHAVGLGPGDAHRISAAGASVVTCPSSNRFLLGALPHWDELERVLVGTDSTLTGPPSLLDELRVVESLGWQPERILAAATHRAAGPLGLPLDAGRLCAGAPAHVIALETRGSSAQSLLAARPGDVRMAMVDGEVRAAHAAVWGQRPGLQGRIAVDGTLVQVRSSDAQVVHRVRGSFASAEPTWLQMA